MKNEFSISIMCSMGFKNEGDTAETDTANEQEVRLNILPTTTPSVTFQMVVREGPQFAQKEVTNIAALIAAEQLLAQALQATIADLDRKLKEHHGSKVLLPEGSGDGVVN